MYDILVHAPNQVTHNWRLREVFQCMREAGVTVNEKCKFSKKFLGNVINAKDIHIDPD